jgi:hypothetical protein
MREKRMKGIIKFKILLIFPLLITVCLVIFPAYAKYGGGTGEPNEPYQIATAEDLMLLGESTEDYDRHFILTADIDLNPNLPGRKVFDKAVIAPDTNDIEDLFQGTPFIGVFDGNSHVISYLTIEGSDYLGLFGQLESGAEIKNLGIVDVNVAGLGKYISGLAGSNLSIISNCYSMGIISGSSSVGGLAGSNGSIYFESWDMPPFFRPLNPASFMVRQTAGRIYDCYSTASVYATDNSCGGLVGRNNPGEINNCYSTGLVSGESSVGGLVGESKGGFNLSSTISNCYSTGIVSRNEDVGGFVGVNSGSIVSSFSTSSTSGQERVGGLVGVNRGGSTEVTGIMRRLEAEVINCYSMGTVSGYTCVGGLVGSNGYVIHISISDLVPETPIPEIPTPEDPIRKIPIPEDPIRKIPIPGIPTRIFEKGIITNCYSTGEVYGSYSVGGLVGNHAGGHGITTASFWDIDTSGQIGSCGGIGMTTAEMQTVSTFIEASWDFMDETDNGTDDIWWIDEGQGYPRLWWEPSSSEWFNDDVFFLVVDDFESYNDIHEEEPGSNRIYNTWVDGFNNPTINGSVVGESMPPFVYFMIANTGRQSMPYYYDNSDLANYSEATANIDNLEIGQDWTKHGIKTLSLWFRRFMDSDPWFGGRENEPEPMYVALANMNGPAMAVYHDDPNATQIAEWTEWRIDLQEFADQGVDLTNINTISIGFGYKNNSQPGGLGKMHFDDIRLYRPDSQDQTP